MHTAWEHLPSIHILARTSSLARMRSLLIAACAAVAAAQYVPVPPTPQMQSDAAAIIEAAFSPENNSSAWNRLAYITDTFGPRFSGTPALEAVLTYVQQTAGAVDGLKVTAEPVTLPRWVRGEEYATMVSPRNKALHFCGLGYSNSTPNGQPITAEVLVVGTYAELQNRSAEAAGKIVLFDWPTWEGYGTTVEYRVMAATWAASVGAAAALIKSIAPWGLQTCHTGVSQPAAVAAGAVSREDSLQMRRMQERGQKVVVTMLMSASIQGTINSVGNLLLDYTSPGAAFPDEYVIVSGHGDSWDIAEGAMDDGGGFTTAWEAVRLISSLKLFSNRTIRAIVWVDEEAGGIGAEQYGVDYGYTFNKTSFAMESDTGAFGLYGLSFTGSADALAQLQLLSPLLEPLGHMNVTTGGSDTDEEVLCAKNVPCGALWPYDPRVGTAANNPCLPFSSALVAPQMPFSVSDGYM